MPLTVHMHTMFFSLLCVTTPSSLCPWVGWGPQCSPGLAWPLQAPPEFPPSTGRDVTGPAPRAAGACPSPGSSVQRRPGRDKGPSAPRHPTHLQRPCHASPRLACCESAVHGSSQGKPTNPLVYLYERQP